MERSHPCPCYADGLACVLEHIQPGDRILDAGCGSGAHLRKLAAATGPHGHVTGLDPDHDALAQAATDVADLIAAGQVRLEQAALDALPLPDDSIDLAWSAAVFHHLADIPQALAELRRVIRPGGRLAIQDADLTGSFPLLPWSPEQERPVLHAAVRAAAEHYTGLDLGPLDPYVARQLPRLLHAADFVNIRIQPVVELDQAPLAPAHEADICSWFLGPLAARLQPFMAPHDFVQFQAAFTPTDPSYVFAEPTAFMLRTLLVMSGEVPA